MEALVSPCKSMQVDFYQGVTRIGAMNKNLHVINNPLIKACNCTHYGINKLKRMAKGNNNPLQYISFYFKQEYPTSDSNS